MSNQRLDSDADLLETQHLMGELQTSSTVAPRPALCGARRQLQPIPFTAAPVLMVPTENALSASMGTCTFNLDACYSPEATLLDTVQRVPQLLECVSSVIGVKSLRLLGNTMSSFAMRQVHSFCIQLMPVPDKAILEAMALLKYTQLQHLRVDITVPTSEGPFYVSYFPAKIQQSCFSSCERSLVSSLHVI